MNSGFIKAFLQFEKKPLKPHNLQESIHYSSHTQSCLWINHFVVIKTLIW